jgi:predicted kinase
LSGRKGKGTGTFISNLEKRESQASRLIWKSVDKNKDRIVKNVYDAFEVVKKKLQQNLSKESV